MLNYCSYFTLPFFQFASIFPVAKSIVDNKILHVIKDIDLDSIRAQRDFSLFELYRKLSEYESYNPIYELMVYDGKCTATHINLALNTQDREVVKLPKFNERESIGSYNSDRQIGYTENDIRVCHADIASENMLLSDDGELYIVDWDTTVLTDYLYDIGQLFARYIEIEDWNNWLSQNNLEYTPNEKKRVRWYAIIHLLCDIKDAHNKIRYTKMNELILKLNRWLEDIEFN